MDIKVNGGSRSMLQQLNKEGPKAGRPSRKPQPRVCDSTTGKNTQKTTNRKVQKNFMSNNSKGKDKAQESLIKGMNNKEVGNNRMTGSSNDEENKKKDDSMKIKAERVIERIGFDAHFVVPSNGQSGGLYCLWNTIVVYVFSSS